MAEQEKPQEQDKESQRRTDAIAESEIAAGFRVRDVPDDVRKALAAEKVDAPLRVRFSRVNPFRRAAIFDAVQKRFHRDFRDPEVLSNTQVMKLADERGEWDVGRQRRMEELQEGTTREMGQLWAEGLTPETTTFVDRIDAAAGRFRDLCQPMQDEAKRAKVLERFDRWAAWSSQARNYPPGYDVGLELAALFDEAPGVEAVDVVTEIDDLKDKQERLVKLLADRVELVELQLRHARIFAGTAESRRDQTEEMAQLYWTCERADAEGNPAGKLAADFDAVWRWPDLAVRWLLYEAFFFHNNVPDVARDYLGAFGFFRAAPASSGSANSAGSPAPPSSRTDGAPAEATPAASSAPSAATT